MSGAVDAGAKIKEKTGTEHIPTPGVDFGVTVSISEERQKKLGMSEAQRAFALKVQQAKEEYNKVNEKFKENFPHDPQGANDQWAKDITDLTRKYGKEIAEAAMK